MKKENLEKIWEEFCIGAEKELKSKKEVNGNVIQLFAEVKWNENGIVEVSALNGVGMKNILDGNTSEYEKDELDTFNKYGKIDKNIPKPMRLDLNSYVTSMPALVVRYSNNECIVTHPNMNKIFDNK